MTQKEVSSVDIDDESILSSIFKDKFSGEERRNPEFLLFLSHLSSYGIHKLNLEPSRLADEKSRILDLTQELAFHNYKTFIRTAKCSQDIFQDFSVIEKRLQNMLDKLPVLSEHGQNFAKEAAGISAIRHSNSLTLTRHTALLEILEIPQLMDTCVRNQYYEDALELMFYVKRLDKKTFVSEIPVITSVIKDVQQSSKLMLEQLLAQLRASIQLPTCLKVVGFLRRLECFTETELRLRFLQARNSWLESVLDSVPVGEDDETDAYDHITRTIEIYRVHLFDIVTQYRAIFSDDSNILYSDGINKRVDDMPYDASIFHCWLTFRINSFIKVLERSLNVGVGNRLDSVLGQCMYFGQSFSRVGADFRCLLVPIFQKAIVTSFTKIIEQSVLEFETSMISYSLVTTSISYNQIPSSGPIATATGSNAIPQPPISLLDFLPLAVYVNGVLSAFNQLRLCMPFSMAVHLPKIISASLKQVARVILSYYYAEEPAFSDTERVSFKRFCNAFTNDALPHFQACIQFLLSHQVISDMYGGIKLPSHQTKDNLLDVEEVMSILEPCLPKKQIDTPVEIQEISTDETSENLTQEVITLPEKPLHSVSSNVSDIDDNSSDKN